MFIYTSVVYAFGLNVRGFLIKDLLLK